VNVTEAYLLIAELCIALDAAPLSKHAGCWEERIDAHWDIAMNGHKKPMQSSYGAEVAPFCAYLRYNGFPAGIASPNGGIIANGSMANEDSFIAAVKTKLTEITRRRDE
jgi:hypothetical protein